MTMFYALIGDIAGSRSLENRAAVQRALQDVLRELNDELSGRGVAAPLKLTAGDEIQGLLAEPALAVDVMVRLADALHPASIQWGLGAGSLDTDLSDDVATLDGPCFHRAREAVSIAKSDRVWLRTGGFPTAIGEGVDALFRLMGALRSRWTEAQLRYIRDARRHRQREVARLHEVDESTVSKALSAARFRDIEEGEEAARRLLGHGAARPQERVRAAS